MLYEWNQPYLKLPNSEQLCQNLCIAEQHEDEIYQLNKLNFLFHCLFN